VTKVPIDPLITLTMQNVAIDFYAMFDDKYADLFTLTADVQLPLSLIFNGCSSVEPAIGNLQMAITNIRTSGTKILAEDPSVLSALIPAVLGFIQPALANLLAGFALPQFSGFKLKVDAAKGVQQVAGTNNYNYLGLYTELLNATAMCAVAAPTLEASLARSMIPDAAQMLLVAGKTPPLPTAILQVSTIGMKGTPEYSYRVDNGFWHDFALPNAQGELSIADPIFLIQGMHQIDVRARMAEAPRGISAPVTIGFAVDWTPPTVQLVVDSPNDTIRVIAHDPITPAAELQYGYQVGPQGDWSSYGASRSIDLSAVDAAGGVLVRVRNNAGLVGEASYRSAMAVAPGSSAKAAGARLGQAQGGCSTADGGGTLLSLLGAMGVVWRRRRGRS
jgi:hypothetical protein